MVNIPKKRLVHLQNIGNMPGTPASKLRVGDRVMWNFGYVSTVERITPSKTGNTITVEFLGSKHPRRFSLTTLVPLATPSRQNDYWWNYDTNVYEQYTADLDPIEPDADDDIDPADLPGNMDDNGNPYHYPTAWGFDYLRTLQPGLDYWSWLDTNVYPYDFQCSKPAKFEKFTIGPAAYGSTSIQVKKLMNNGNWEAIRFFDAADAYVNYCEARLWIGRNYEYAVIIGGSSYPEQKL